MVTMQPVFSLLLFALMSVLLTFPVLGRQVENAHDEFQYPTAQEVIDKNVQAVGGYELLASRNNLHYFSNGHSSSGSVFTYEVYQADGRFRSRFDYQDGRVIERGIRADQKLDDVGNRLGYAWEFSTGNLREIVGEERQEYLRRRSSMTALTRMFDYYKSIVFDSTESIDEREVNKLILTDHNGKEVERYYDSETGLLRRQICVEAFSNTKMRVVRDYLNYEQVGEYMISKKQVITQSSGTVWTYEIESYKVDARIPRGTFDLPKPIEQSIANAAADKKAAEVNAVAVAEKASEQTETIQKTETVNVDKTP